MSDGWYVKQLLIHSDQIHSSVYTENKFGTVWINFDSDMYNDLLSVEMKIKQMRNKNIFSIKEDSLIQALFDGVTIFDMPDYLGLSINTTKFLFDSICSKIAYFMGSYFTNDGYIDKFFAEHNLHFTQDNLEFLKKTIYGS